MVGGCDVNISYWSLRWSLRALVVAILRSRDEVRAAHARDRPSAPRRSRGPRATVVGASPTSHGVIGTAASVAATDRLKSRR